MIKMTTSPLPRSPFIFAVCQVGAEIALKKEITRVRPTLRFSYSRPGFVTFKSNKGELDAGFSPDSVFARAYGLSFGKAGASDVSRVVDFARPLREAVGTRLRLHAWERDQHFPGDEPMDYVRGRWSDAALKALRDSADPREWDVLFEPDPIPRDGDAVLDLVAIEEGEWWFGYHTHSPTHSPAPGGRFDLPCPPEAPSRAYVKLEEAIRWARLPIRTGDQAVEIGSAPGGASWALLQRGLRVTGIDPGEMDARVLAHPGFRHLRKPASHVLRNELPEAAHWLLLDMNSEPKLALAAAEGIVAQVGNSLLGAVLTIKLNHWGIADQIPAILDRVRAMGMVRIRATQLASNRQEIAVAGLTRRSLVR